MWSLHVPPCLRGFPPSAPVSPPLKNMYISLSPVSALDQGVVSEYGVGPRSLCLGCPLLFRDGLNAENEFYCTLYMLLIKYLYLITDGIAAFMLTSSGAISSLVIVTESKPKHYSC